MLVENSPQASLTFLNHCGDVTISWDDENKEEIKAMVEKKMKQGFSFFVVREVKSKGRAPKVKFASEIDTIASKQLKVDNKVDGRVLDDDDLVKALTSGVIRIERKKETKPATNKASDAPLVRANTPEEVVNAQSIAIKPITGG
jgi:uncharacterized Zn ribbon protein